MTNRTHYISINPDLINEFGHYLHYDLRIKEEIATENFTILANQKFGNHLLDQYPFVIPVFSNTTYQEVPLIDYRSLNPFKSALQNLLSVFNNQAESNYIFYMYMGSIWHALALLELATEFKNSLFHFHINIFHDRKTFLSADFSKSKYFTEYKKIIQAIENQNLNIHIYADTKLSKKMLTQQLNFRFQYLPMFTVTDFDRTKKVEVDEKKHFSLVYAGNVQADKGFDLIVKWLEQIDLEKENVIFKCRIFLSYYNKKHESWVKAIEASEKIELINGKLSEIEYTNLIESADLLLIPYRTAAFRGRTSGIYADAIERKKPVLVASETWMSEYTKRYENGCIFEDGSVDDLGKQFHQLKSNYTFYKNRAEFAQREWLTENGIENFIQIFDLDQQPINFDGAIFSNDRMEVKKAIQKRRDSIGKRVLEKLKKNPVLWEIKQRLKL